ncbi:MAG: hypothetical protein QM781_16595 [Chitinophagaceae bacterium]
MIRKLFMLPAFLAIVFFAAGQSNSDVADCYLLKSRKQHRAAVITLSCSAATLIPGVIVLSNIQPGWEYVNWNKALGGTALVAAGTGLAISSAVLFIASAKNRNRAQKARVFVNRPVSVSMGRTVTILPYSVGIVFPIR